MVAGSFLRQQLRAQQNPVLRNLIVQKLGGSRTQTRRLASSQAARKAPSTPTPTPKATTAPKTTTVKSAEAASSSPSTSDSSSTSSPTPTPSSSSSSSSNAVPTPTVPGKVGSTREPTWLTKQLKKSPTAMKVFLAFTRALGYGTPKQVAGQRSFVIYEYICAVRPDEDRDFWLNGLHLPPTFQTWFTITNIHVWLLTVRFRALPAGYGRHYHQALIDHFFLDIEDRIRDILQPPARPLEPYTFHTNFYVNPNAPARAKGDDQSDAPVENKKQKRVRVPDRIVTQQMKIFKEQWQGMGLSFDLGLVTGDEELAGAVWRNLLGARGAQGIDYASAADPSAAPRYRRSVNLLGGEVVDVSKIDFEAEQTKDDGSGVHDFPPSEVDKYVEYPERMLDIVRYMRRELKRLEAVSDEDIISGEWRMLKFNNVKDGAKTGAAEGL